MLTGVSKIRTYVPEHSPFNRRFTVTLTTKEGWTRTTPVRAKDLTSYKRFQKRVLSFDAQAFVYMPAEAGTKKQRRKAWFNLLASLLPDNVAKIDIDK